MRAQIRINARFVGEDSLGYKRGEWYDLVVDVYQPGFAELAIPYVGLLTGTYPLTITRREGGGRCPYSNWPAFLRNWSKVTMTHEAESGALQGRAAWNL